MEKLLDITAIADLLSVKKRSVYGLVRRYEIPHLKLSRRMLRFRMSDITEWIAQLDIESPGILTKVKTSRRKEPRRRQKIAGDPGSKRRCREKT